MANHAFCDEHSVAEADPVNCPFCDDRDAYLEYEKKVGRREDPFAGAKRVPLGDILGRPSTD